MTWFFTFTLLFLAPCASAQFKLEAPRITAVNAMCSSEGITASLDFDRPFNGKIYSLDYANVHECIYYNTMDMDTVLFSIPAHRCGTKLSRTTRNVIDQMENRVYVQMDKDTQTAADKQFSFVCQLASTSPIAPINSNANNIEIRRHPVAHGPYLAKETYETAPDLIQPTVQQSSSMDAYAAEPPQTNVLHNDIPPISAKVGLQSSNQAVPTISAVSSSSSFGNWPIPGAVQYNPNIPPKSSMPKFLAPISPLVTSHTTTTTQSSYIVHDNGIDGQSFAEKEKQLLGISAQESFSASGTSVNSYVSKAINGIDSLRLALASRDRVDGVEALRELKEKQRAQGIQFNPLIGVGLEPASIGSTEKVEARPWADITLPSRLVPPPPKTEMSHDSSNDVFRHGYPLPPVHQQPAYIQPSHFATTRIAPISADVRRAPIRPLPPTAHVNADSYVTPNTQIFLNNDLTTRSYPTVDIPPPPLPTPDVHRPSVSFTNDPPDLIDEQLSVDRMIAEQKPVKQEVFLEIQMGNGPGAPTVSRPIKIGENMTLVVRSATPNKDPNSYDMFVHSCFATDGPGTTKIELIDKNGCVTRPQVVSQMQRRKDVANSQIIYFFRISAFKFPGPDDVYFSCSVELTPDEAAPEICAAKSQRSRRDAVDTKSIRLFDSVNIELQEEFERYKRAADASSNSMDHWCFATTTFMSFGVLLICLVFGMFATGLTALRLHFVLQHYLQKRTPY